MRVKTLSQKDFTAHCRRLEERAAVFAPDLIVTIATGGDYVGAGMFASVPHVSVRLQRPSTAKKRSPLMSIVRRLPRFMRDWLRIAEALWLSRSASHRKLPSSPLSSTATTSLPDSETRIGSELSILNQSDGHGDNMSGLLSKSVREVVSKAGRILIVDDAVDSGATLLRVAETLRSASPEAQIASAVITVTTRNPAIKPDYTLYNDRTLIRFPWSADN